MSDEVLPKKKKKKSKSKKKKGEKHKLKTEEQKPEEDKKDNIKLNAVNKWKAYALQHAIDVEANASDKWSKYVQEIVADEEEKDTSNSVQDLNQKYLEESSEDEQTVEEMETSEQQAAGDIESTNSKNTIVNHTDTCTGNETDTFNSQNDDHGVEDKTIEAAPIESDGISAMQECNILMTNRPITNEPGEDTATTLDVGSFSKEQLEDDKDEETEWNENEHIDEILNIDENIEERKNKTLRVMKGHGNTDKTTEPTVDGDTDTVEQEENISGFDNADNSNINSQVEADVTTGSDDDLIDDVDSKIDDDLIDDVDSKIGVNDDPSDNLESLEDEILRESIEFEESKRKEETRKASVVDALIEELDIDVDL